MPVPAQRFARLCMPRPEALAALILTLLGHSEGEVRSGLASEAPWFEPTNREVEQIMGGVVPPHEPPPTGPLVQNRDRARNFNLADKPAA